MAYRKREYVNKKCAAMRAAKERQRIEGVSPDYPPDLPDLRRTVVVTDYDTGEPLTYRIDLYRSDRIDCYTAVVAGRVWRRRVGWSRVLEGIRKSFAPVRVP